jgi:hypothetical protein
MAILQVSVTSLPAVRQRFVAVHQAAAPAGEPSGALVAGYDMGDRRHELSPMLPPNACDARGGTMERALRCALTMLLALVLSPATAQDVPGLETCTAEKQIERRTGCLQSNDDFLAQTISKLARETHARMTASGRELTAAKAEIATLRSAMEKLNGELAQIKERIEATSKR